MDRKELLKRLDKRFYFDSSIIVTHFHRTDFRHFYEKQRNLGVGFYTSRKHNRLMGYQLTKSRLFTFGIPIFRMVRIWRKVLRGGLKYFPSLFLASPVIFYGLLAYSTGFWKAFDAFHAMTQTLGKNDEVGTNTMESS